MYGTKMASCHCKIYFKETWVKQGGYLIQRKVTRVPARTGSGPSWLQSTHRVEMADFWRSFHHGGKISQGWWGWEVHALPLFHSIYHYVRSCSVRSSWESRYTLPISSLTYVYSVALCGPECSRWQLKIYLTVQAIHYPSRTDHRYEYEQSLFSLRLR